MYDAASVGMVAEAAATAVAPIIAKQRDQIRDLLTRLDALEARLTAAEVKSPVVTPDALDVALADLRTRILREIPTIEGKPGKDADVEEIAQRLLPEIERAVAQIPPAKPGDPGKDADPAEVAARLLPEIERLVGEVHDKMSTNLRSAVSFHAARECEMAVEARLKAEVERAVDALPSPEPSETPTAAEILALIRPELVKAVAELPPPEKGDPGPAPTDEQIRKAVGEVVDAAMTACADDITARLDEKIAGVRRSVDTLLAPITATLADQLENDEQNVALITSNLDAVNERLDALEARDNPTPEDIRDEIDKRDAALMEAVRSEFSEFRSRVDAEVERGLQTAVAAMPPPEKGDPGPAPTPDEIRNVLLPELERAIAALPPPEKGDPGATPTPDQLREIILPELRKAVDALPPPEKGDPGLGVQDVLIDRSGALIFTMQDGTIRNLGRVEGKDGTDGIDGKDGVDGQDGHPGLGFDDMDMALDGLRNVVVRLTRGDRVKEFVFSFPVLLDAGVYREGEEYQPGDCVSFGGSMWACQAATTEKPGTGNSWRLAVKHGRDGRSPDLEAFVERSVPEVQKRLVPGIRKLVTDELEKRKKNG